MNTTLFLSLLLMAISLSAQNTGYSPITDSPINLNPATTGNFRNENLRVVLSGCPNFDRMPNSDSYFLNFSLDKIINKSIGVGNSFTSVKTNNGAYSEINNGLSISYSFKLRKDYYANIGFEGKMKYAVIDYSYITHIENQKTRNLYPCLTPAVLIHRLNNKSKLSPWLGLSYQTQLSYNLLNRNDTLFSRSIAEYYICSGLNYTVNSKVQMIASGDFLFLPRNKYSHQYLNQKLQFDFDRISITPGLGYKKVKIDLFEEIDAVFSLSMGYAGVKISGEFNYCVRNTLSMVTPGLFRFGLSWNLPAKK